MGNQIKSKEATKLCDNYDTKNNNIKNLINIDDNRSCLFTIKEIKDYISYIEKNSSEANGLRIYIGSYSENETKASNNKLTTLFLSPTIDGVDDKSLNAYNYGGLGNPPGKKYGK